MFIREWWLQVEEMAKGRTGEVIGKDDAARVSAR